MSRYIMLAMTNAVPGREEEFNDWYTNEHLREVAQAPGIRAAQRFELASTQRYIGEYPFHYLAIYEIETDDLQATVDYLNEHVGTERVPVRHELLTDEPEIRGLYFTPISDRAEF